MIPEGFTRLNSTQWWPDIIAGPTLIGIAGSVAAGKTTLATELQHRLHDRWTVEIVSTDGFLKTTAALGPRAGMKGFPDTYDTDLIATVMGALRRGERVEMPRYDHAVYDIAGPPQVVDRPDVVIVEGVNALSAAVARWLDTAIYLDAEEADIRSWYVARFRQMLAAGKDDPTSFFHQWAGLDAASGDALAVAVWEGVNLPNLEQHILPSRAQADVIVHKNRAHEVEWVAVRRAERCSPSL